MARRKERSRGLALRATTVEATDGNIEVNIKRYRGKRNHCSFFYLKSNIAPEEGSRKTLESQFLCCSMVQGCNILSIV